VSVTSQILVAVGFAVLIAGMAIPGRDTAALPKRAVKRRIYWMAYVAAVAILCVAAFPDVQSMIGMVGAATILAVGWAYFRTPNLKIGGQIYAAYPPHREPDPPVI
jgi:hypothetical protein